MTNPHASFTRTQNPPQPEDLRIVFVVDDDISVRESLQLMIEQAGWQPVLLESATAFLAQPQPAVPSCLLLDVHLPDLNGLDLQARIADGRPHTPIIFITGYGDVPLTVRAMKAGAVDVLTKPYDGDVLLRAVADGLARSEASLEGAERLRSLRARQASLTHREQQVLDRVVMGQLNKQIAAELGISEITVKAHRGRLMRKMKARSVPELVKMVSALAAGSSA